MLISTIFFILSSKGFVDSVYDSKTLKTERFNTFIELSNTLDGCLKVTNCDTTEQQIIEIFKRLGLEYEENVSKDSHKDKILFLVHNKQYKIAEIFFKSKNYVLCIEYLEKIPIIDRFENYKNMLITSYSKIGNYYKSKYLQCNLQNLILKNEFKNSKYNFDEIIESLKNHGILFYKKIEEYVIGRKFFRSLLMKFLFKKRLKKQVILVILKIGYHLLSNLDNISFVDTDKEVFVFGSTLGYFYHTFGFFNNINGNKYKFYEDFQIDTNKIFIFNGNYVGEGPQSIQNYIFLLILKILYPANIFLNRGNNEFKEVFFSDNLAEQINELYYPQEKDASGNKNLQTELYDAFQLTFSMHPIATVINRKIFVENGGLLKSIESFDQSFNLDRKTMVKFENDILHGYMQNCFLEIDENSNKSKLSHYYNISVIKSFLERNNFDFIVTNNIESASFFNYFHENTIISICSSPNFYDSKSVKSCYLIFKNEGKIKVGENVSYDLVEIDNITKEDITKLENYEKVRKQMNNI
ncbi:serine/threonine protein phosphatase Pzh1 [Gurleya vavrai]